MKALNQLTLAQRFSLLIAAFVLGFSVYGAWTLKTLAEVQVNGPMYQSIIQGKDLIADVLPPPTYILESYLTVLHLAQAKGTSEKAAHIEKLKKLRMDYDRRHDYWVKQSLDGELAAAFLKQAHEPAITFFQIGFDEFVPAVLAGDELNASSSLARLSDAYLKHRQAIDLVVQLTEKRNLASETASRDRIVAAYQLLFLVLALCIAAGISFSVLITRSLTQSLGGEPAALGEASRRIASGDLDFDMGVSPNNQDSVLYQIDMMRKQLKERRRLEQAQQESDRRASNAEAELRIAEQMAQTELEKKEIYVSMARAAQHVLNNLLNQLQLFKLAADQSSDFDRNILDMYDGVTNEAAELIERLASVKELNDKNIMGSVAPRR